MRRDAQGVLRPLQPMNGIVPAHPIAGVAAMNGHQIKKMPPPNTGLQMRISSNGGMRPPMTAVSNVHSNGGSSSHQISPPQVVPVPVAQHSSPMTGVSRAAINLPQVDVHKPTDIIGPPAIPNGIPLVTVPQPDVNGSGNVEVTANGSPPRPKPQNQNPTTPQPQLQPHLGTVVPINGYHLSPLAAAYSHSQSPPQLSNLSNGGGGLSQQQMRDLKSVFANMPGPDLGTLQNASRAMSSPYMHLGPNGPNMNGIQLLPGANIGNLKLPPAAAAARQMQWGTIATANVTGSPIMQMQQIPMQRPGSVVNGNHLMDGQLAVNGGNALPSPNLGAAGLPGSPSMRSGLRNGMLVNGQPHSMSPLMRHSPSPLPNISHLHSQSPTRMPMTPNMAIIGSSPSLQHQQPPQTQSIGSTLNGY
jgi:enhancer of polycomb-like protein